MTVEEVLGTCSDVGFTNFEIFTDWVRSAFDIARDPAAYLDLAGTYGMTYTSMHLPKVTVDDEGSFETAVRGARFARALGVEVVIFKSTSREGFIEYGTRFLDRAESLGLTTVVTNHGGSPIVTLADYEHVLNGVDDPRMKALLEVGHFHAAGVHWKDACTALEDRIGLVHVKDMSGSAPVRYGTGDIDFRALFSRLSDFGYDGPIVVELEKVPREEAVPLLEHAVSHVRSALAEAGLEVR